MSDLIPPVMSPGRKLRSGVVGWIGLIFCGATLLAFATLVLLNPG